MRAAAHKLVGHSAGAGQKNATAAARRTHGEMDQATVLLLIGVEELHQQLRAQGAAAFSSPRAA